jgi:hypothetical protein
MGNHNSKIAGLVGGGRPGLVSTGVDDATRGRGGGLPVTGASPVLTVAVGSLLVGFGLLALLVRRSAARPGRRPGTGRHHP